MKSGPFTTRKRAINSLKLKLMFYLNDRLCYDIEIFRM